MTDRERRIRTLAFGSPDRVPLEPGYGRRSTLRRWHAEGLPAEVTGGDEIAAFAYRTAGGREELPVAGDGFPVDVRMIPQFEEKVLERRGDTQVVQDWKGNVCEIGAEFDVTYLRTAVDFVTRRWIRCPVESRSDWLDVARRYDPADPSRLPGDAADRARRLADRGWMVSLGIPGPFWQLREWLGFERLCTLFYDDLPFLRQMIGFWSAFVALVLERTFSVLVPDEIHLSEDMAFKGFSMISPAMVREHLLPVWTRWGRLIREAGCPVYAMDSDGYVGELIPLWIEAGITVCDPVEVAAGNDLAAFRARFGRRMAYRGGVDKRAIAKGGAAIEEEIARVGPVIASGGYIPGCDHGVPADVSWPDFVRYVGLLARATGWM
jgi:hypothetical protein